MATQLLQPPKDELDEMLIKCSKHLKYHCQFFFGGQGGRFARPFSTQHEKLFEIYDDETVKKILVLAHRGFGKTSIFNLGVPSQHILFGKSRFIVPVSATSGSAIMQSENLKRELMANPYANALIGSIKSEENTFAQDNWVTTNGERVYPRSPGAQVRGILHENSRMELGLCDDLETVEGVQNPEQRDKLKNWFMDDFCKAVQMEDGEDYVGKTAQENYRIIVVGTVLHQASLLEDLRDDPTWTTVDLPLADENMNSNWKYFMTDKAVSDLKYTYEVQGKVENFYREYMNTCTPSEDATFKQEFFRYYTPEEHNFESDEFETMVLLDPAKTGKQHNDFTAIVGVSVHERTQKIYIRDIINKHLTPDAIYKQTYDMADRLGATVIGYEVTGLNEFIVQPMETELHRSGRSLELVQLKARKGEGAYSMKNKGKEGRIAGLAPYYRTHQIYHLAGTCDVLEQQLMAFPRAKFDDVMDCFAYTVEMLALGMRFPEEGGYLGDDKDEFKQLEEDDEEPWEW